MAPARPSIATAFGNARLQPGHSDVHIRDMLAKFLTQHLVQIEEEDIKKIINGVRDHMLSRRR